MTDTQWWVNLISVVVGGFIAGGASFGGIFFTQRATDDRSLKERLRLEERVRALFAARTEHIFGLLTWQVEDGSVPDLNEFDRRLAPLRSAFEDKSLTLALEPRQIESLANALLVLDLNLRTGARQNEFFDQEYAAASTGEEKLQSLDRRKQRMKAVFKSSHRAFGDALKALRRESDQDAT